MNKLKPIYLISGNDQAKVKRALERLRKRFGEGAEERVSARDLSGAEAATLLSAFTLGSDGRLVIVTDAERWKKADAEAIEDYLANPIPDALLVLVGNPQGRSALRATVDRHGEILSFSVSDPWHFAAEELSRRGVQATKGAVRALVELRGREPEALLPELEKLATYADDKPLDEDAVRSLVAAPREEVAAFALQDAWGARDSAAMLRACELIAHSGDADWVRTISALTTHARRVLLCQGLREQGIQPEQAASRYGLHPYAARKAYAHSRRFRRDELEVALLLLGRLSADLTGGSPVAPAVLVERTVVAIS